MSFCGAWEGGWVGGWEGALAGGVPAPAPLTTTWPIIRDLQLELLRELVPTVLPTARFRTWETNELDFFAWADAAAGSFRRFTIERLFDDAEPRFLLPGVSQVGHSEVVLIAYPMLLDYEGRRLDDVIDQDIADVTRALGLRARSSYATISQGLLCGKRMFAARERGIAAQVAVIQFRLDYDRTMP